MAMDASAYQVTGRGGLHERVEFAGRTDRQIARDLLRAGGNTAPTESDVDRLIDAYVDALSRGVKKRPYRALSGVREAVEALRSAGAVVGLGTGNVPRGARVKLTSAGLIDLFDLALGGFGDDAITRDELLRVGARRCDPEGRLPVVIIGDTPHDIRAAQAIGAYCVAVTTGPYDAESLAAVGPNLLLEQLDGQLVGLIDGVLAESP